MTEENIVEEWLRSFNLNQYAESFLDNGYDDLEICKQIGEDDLDAIGVTDDLHRQQILRAVRELLEQGGSAVYFTVEEQRKSDVDRLVEWDVFCDGSLSGCLSTKHPVTSIKPRMVSSEGTAEVSGSYGCCGGAFVSVQGCASSRFAHEYEENKLGFIKLPKVQLKKMIRDKLIREGIRLSAQPYSNMDGSRGQLEKLARRYSEELRTYYQDVMERLEELRRRRFAIDKPPFPMNNVGFPASQLCFRPGKYSPSSCLSDQEYENIYGMYGTTEYKNTIATSPKSCLSSNSWFCYEPCSLLSDERKNGKSNNDHQKKKGGLGRLFRNFGAKKDRDKSKRFHGKNVSKTSNFWSSAKHYSEAMQRLPQSQLDDLWIENESTLHLIRIVQEGYRTIEHTAQKDFSKAEKGNVFSPADIIRSDSDYLPVGQFGHLVRISYNATSNSRPVAEGNEVPKCSSNDPTKTINSSCDGKCGNIMCSVKADPSPEWPPDLPTRSFLSTLTQKIPEESCNDIKSHSSSSANYCCNDISKCTYDTHINNKLSTSHPQDFPVFTDTMVKALSYPERKQCEKLPFLNELESTFDIPSLILNHDKTDVPKLLGSPSNHLHSRSTSEEALSTSSGNDINVCEQTNPDTLVQSRNSLEHFRSQTKCRSKSQPRVETDVVSQGKRSYFLKPDRNTDLVRIIGTKERSTFLEGESILLDRANQGDFGNTKLKSGQTVLVEDADDKNTNNLDSNALSSATQKKKKSFKGRSIKHKNVQVPENYQSHYSYATAELQPGSIGISRTSFA
ncbi:uncharacterized protein LOC143223482 isoform X2 [Tachypleus tridentatus]|uniref:uncharacterized protein LOC143223482 isoform X2 n=1 Tax=Tachypleus tridentatus TaxID=6853 RepID=UPI003FD178A4